MPNVDCDALWTASDDASQELFDAIDALFAAQEVAAQNIDEAVRAAEAAATAVEARDAALQERPEVEAAITAAHDQVEQLEQNLVDLQAQRDALIPDREAAAERLQQAIDELERIGNELHAFITEAASLAEQLDDPVVRNDPVLYQETLDHYNEVSAEVDTLQADWDYQSTVADDADADLSAIDDQIADIEGQVAETGSEIDSERAAIADGEARLDEIDQAIEEGDNAAQEAEAAAEAADAAQADLDAAQTAYEAASDASEAAFNEWREHCG
jgi:methyl-accepting chemotaxis protein